MRATIAYSLLLGVLTASCTVDDMSSEEAEKSIKVTAVVVNDLNNSGTLSPLDGGELQLEIESNFQSLFDFEVSLDPAQQDVAYLPSCTGGGLLSPGKHRYTRGENSGYECNLGVSRDFDPAKDLAFNVKLTFHNGDVRSLAVTAPVDLVKADVTIEGFAVNSTTYTASTFKPGTKACLYFTFVNSGPEPVFAYENVIATPSVATVTTAKTEISGVLTDDYSFLAQGEQTELTGKSEDQCVFFDIAPAAVTGTAFTIDFEFETTPHSKVWTGSYSGTIE